MMDDDNNYGRQRKCPCGEKENRKFHTVKPDGTGRLRLVRRNCMY